MILHFRRKIIQSPAPGFRAGPAFYETTTLTASLGGDSPASLAAMRVISTVFPLGRPVSWKLKSWARATCFG